MADQAAQLSGRKRRITIVWCPGFTRYWCFIWGWRAAHRTLPCWTTWYFENTYTQVNKDKPFTDRFRMQKTFSFSNVDTFLHPRNALEVVCTPRLVNDEIKWHIDVNYKFLRVCMHWTHHFSILCAICTPSATVYRARGPPAGGPYFTIAGNGSRSRGDLLKQFAFAIC